MEFEKLKKVIADVLNVDPEEITMESTFVDDLGADSLDVFQIIMGLEEVFDIEIPAEEAEKITTVEEAVNLIKKVKEGMMTSLRSKIGALLVKPALKNTLKAFDLEQYGGAPMLGLNGLVVKTHGSSKAVEIKNSVLQCITFKEQNINEKIKEKITMEES